MAFCTGTQLFNNVIDICLKLKIGTIYLHLETNNVDAINSYKIFENHRHGQELLHQHYTT